jgi:pimeloyl-ACP methyl ester carboxylesterase
MTGELVQTTTPDHVGLHGFYRRSDARLATSPESGSVDGAVLLHGLGGNFYSSRLLLHFANTLYGLGISVVVANTRGHDMISTSTWAGRAKSVGAAFENVADATMDVSAWAEFMVHRGHRDVLILGHSLGAIKALYAQANGPHPKVRSIIAMSATRLSYTKLMESPRGELFRETIERCRGLIEQQQGDDPILVPYPFPTWMTPQCYLDKYGPAETFNWISFVDKVDVPTLMLFGQKELDENPAFEGLRPELEDLRTGWNPLTIEEVEDADHFYTSRFDSVDDHLVRWLTR